MRTSVPTAEMIKYASNAFLATKISFINEIANVCEQVGADVRTVAQGMGLDHRIGPHFLQAGIGYGGSCFPKDVQALKQLAGNSGYHFQLLNAVIEVNALQKRRVVGKLKQRLGGLRGKTVALLGLTFKPHTDDLREAASIVLAGAPASTKARRCAPTTPCSTPATHPLFPGVTHRRRAAARRSRAPTPPCWSPSGPSSRASTGRAAAAVMTRPLLIDGRNFIDPAVGRGGRPRVRGHRPRRPGSPSRRRLSQRPVSAGRRTPTQAVILVGGEGTRLRPVTSRVPKPVAPVVERPFVAYILDNLARHGVERAVFSTGFLAAGHRGGDRRRRRLRPARSTTRSRTEPLGTAGAIANCAERRSTTAASSCSTATC